MKPYARSLITIERKSNHKRFQRYFFFALVVTFALYRVTFSLILQSSSISITAHRGSTMIAPENTVPAIIEAIAQDVDYIEIDVQLSKDNIVFLLHDSTFKRTAGVSKRPWELTYEEIQELNVGAYKNTTLPISAPTLEEIIQICQLTDVKLNIELKNYGHSQKLVSEVIRILRDYDFLNRCVITSNYSSLLKEVRKLEPTIKIGLITRSTSLATYLQNSFVDVYSVHYLALSPSIVLYAHSHGKEIFCWTPSNTVSIEAAIKMGSDNIITNNIPLTKLFIISAH